MLGSLQERALVAGLIKAVRSSSRVPTSITFDLLTGKNVFALFVCRCVNLIELFLF